MGFHPKMYVTVSGFHPLEDLHSLVVGDMTIDLWHVECTAAAHGRYVSIHPRIFVMLDGGRLNLAPSRSGPLRSCVGCYVPAGAELWSCLTGSQTPRHIDIHMTRARMKTLLDGGAPPSKPIFFENLTAIEEIAKLLSDKSKPSAVRVRLAECIMLEVLGEAAAPRPNGRSKDLLASLRSFVQNNMARRINVDELATAVDLSRTKLNSEVRALTGASPYQWLLEQKIDHAKVLLRKGRRFAEIARLTGFSDQAHFNRVFKAATGIAPGRWTIEQAPRPDSSNVQDRSNIPLL
ncbi:MAG: AraC family transcriptional regulator [Pseudomonadota bacterium]